MRGHWYLLVYATLAVAIGFVDVRMRPHTDHVVASYIPGVVAGTESAPGLYRVLAPFTIDAAARMTGASLLATWHASRLLFLFAAFYLRTRPGSGIGVVHSGCAGYRAPEGGMVLPAAWNTTSTGRPGGTGQTPWPAAGTVRSVLPNGRLFRPHPFRTSAGTGVARRRGPSISCLEHSSPIQ